MAKDDRTDVYRLFDSEWDLIYVGISRNAFYRFKQHRHRTWWSSVFWVQIFTYSTREFAEAVEAAAIRNEYPQFNIDRGSWRARDAYPIVESESWRREVDYFDEHISQVVL